MRIVKQGSTGKFESSIHKENPLADPLKVEHNFASVELYVCLFVKKNKKCMYVWLTTSYSLFYNNSQLNYMYACIPHLCFFFREANISTVSLKNFYLCLMAFRVVFLIAFLLVNNTYATTPQRTYPLYLSLFELQPYMMCANSLYFISFWFAHDARPAHM